MKKNWDDMVKLEEEVITLKGLVTEWEKDIVPKHAKLHNDTADLSKIKYRMDLKLSRLKKI